VKLKDAKTGDTLVLTHSYPAGKPDEEVTVAKVGREYLYVTDATGHRLSARYNRDTGNESTATSRLYTREGLAEERERAELVNTLRVLGVELPNAQRHGVPVAMLRALEAAVTADYDAPPADGLAERAVAAGLTRDRATLARDARSVAEQAARVAEDPEQAHRLGYVVRLAEDAQALALLATRIRAVADTGALYSG
jgi:hypothetical protein